MLCCGKLSSNEKVTEGITYGRKQINRDTNGDESSNDRLHSISICLGTC